MPVPHKGAEVVAESGAQRSSWQATRNRTGAIAAAIPGNTKGGQIGRPLIFSVL